MCGSVSRQAFSSRVGTEKLTLTSATSASRLKWSRSRSASGDFVSTDAGVSVSRSASSIGGISS